MKQIVLVTASTALLLLACATEIAPFGPDTYMASKQGASIFASQSGLQADTLNKAASYCSKQGRYMLPVRTQWQTDARGIPNAQLIFRCLREGDPELSRQGPWTTDPSVKVDVDVH